ncbi:MAG TPA: DUF4157 domain-containing protein [Bacteroidia bacterium]|nr:DUF4157 domain-containing protein [Bacteroidia bacterium]
MQKTYISLNRIRPGDVFEARQAALYTFFKPSGKYKPDIVFRNLGGNALTKDRFGPIRHKKIQLDRKDKDATIGTLVADYLHEMNHYIDMWSSSRAAPQELRRKKTEKGDTNMGFDQDTSIYSPVEQNFVLYKEEEVSALGEALKALIAKTIAERKELANSPNTKLYKKDYGAFDKRLKRWCKTNGKAYPPTDDDIALFLQIPTMDTYSDNYERQTESLEGEPDYSKYDIMDGSVELGFVFQKQLGFFYGKPDNEDFDKWFSSYPMYKLILDKYEKKYDTISKRSESSFAGSMDGEFGAQLSASKGHGQSLDDSTKAEMGSKMGATLDNVRVHTGSAAHAMSESVNAKAFTHGEDIYFKNGNYNPKSSEGKELLSHELVHTQQQGDGVSRKIQRQTNTSGSALQKLGKIEIPKLPATTKSALSTDLSSDSGSNSINSNDALYVDRSTIIIKAKEAEAYQAIVTQQRTDFESRLSGFKATRQQETDAANAKALAEQEKQPKPDPQVDKLTQDLEIPEKRYAAIIKLGDLREKGGWGVLLENIGNPDQSVGNAVFYYFGLWIKEKDGFLDFLIDTANAHQSVLSAYATDVLIRNKYASNVDKTAYVDALKSKLDLLKIQYSIIPDKIIPAVGDTDTSYGIAFNRTIDTFSATLSGQSLSYIANADKKATDIRNYLGMAIQTLGFTGRFCATDKPDLRQGVPLVAHGIFGDVLYHTVKLAGVLYDTGKEVRLDEKNGDEINRGIYAETKIIQYNSTAKTKIDAAIISELKSKATSIKDSVVQVELALKSPYYFNMLQAKAVLTRIQAKADALEGMMTELTDLAVSNPEAFYDFYKDIGTTLHSMAVGLYAMGTVLVVDNAYRSYDKSNLLNWGGAVLGGALGEYIASDYQKTRMKELESYLTRSIDAVIKSETNPTDAYADAMLINASPTLYTLLENAKSFAEIEQAFNYVVATVIAIAIVIASIFTMGALAPELMGALGAVEILTAEGIGTGYYAFSISAAPWLGAALGIGTTVAVNSATFLLTQKLLTTMIFGKEAAGWDRLGKDYLETMLTFGALGVLGEGFKAFEAGAEFSTGEKALWEVTKFGIENIAFVSLNAMFTAVENYYLPPDKQKEFNVISELGNSVVFLLGMRLGMMATTAFSKDIKIDAGSQKKLDDISTDITNRIKEVADHDLSPTEQAELQKDIASLWRQRAQVLRDAAELPENSKNKARILQAAKLYDAKATEVETGGIASFNVRKSYEAPDTFLFEGDSTAFTKEILRGKKGATLERSPLGKNIWIYKEGKITRTFINVVSTKEFSPKLETVLKEKGSATTIEDVRSKFWEQAGMKEMASVEGSDRIITDAMNKGWDPDTSTELPELVKLNAERFNRTQKGNKLYDRFGKDYTKVEDAIKDLVYKTPLDVLDRVLPQVDTPENMNRLGKLFPDLSDVKNINSFGDGDYINTTNAKGEPVIRIDNAPNIGDALSGRLYQDMPTALKIDRMISGEPSENKTNLQNSINGLSDKGIKLLTDINGKMNVPIDELINRADVGAKNDYNAQKTVDFFDAKDLSTDINNNQELNDLRKERKRKGLRKVDKYADINTELTDLQNQLNDVLNPPKNPDVIKNRIQQIKNQLLLDEAAKKLGDYLKENKLRGKNVFDNQGAYDHLVEAAKAYIDNGGTDVLGFLDYLKSNSHTDNVKWNKAEVKNKVDKAFEEGKKQSADVKQKAEASEILKNTARGLSGSGLKMTEEGGTKKFFSPSGEEVVEITADEFIPKKFMGESKGEVIFETADGFKLVKSGEKYGIEIGFKEGRVLKSETVNGYEFQVKNNKDPYEPGTLVTDKTLKNGDKLYVAEYKDQKQPGSFSSKDPISSIEELREKLAVLEDWKDETVGEIVLREYEIENEIRVRDGVIGPQTETKEGPNKGKVYKGGGQQYEFVDKKFGTREGNDNYKDYMNRINEAPLLK